MKKDLKRREVGSGKDVYKILIVDDEMDVLNSLNLTLKSAKEFNSEITTVSDAESALASMLNEEFDLVLADFKMPGMNGIDLLTEVKQKHPKTARILITGYTDVDTAMDAINKAKVDHYIEKPCHKDKLRNTVWDALQRKKA
jgi:DNA-binding NtrC family response regulator